MSNNIQTNVRISLSVLVRDYLTDIKIFNIKNDEPLMCI